MQANRHMAQVEQEMARLYRTYAPGLLTYVRMRVPSPEDAEDLVVEVFLAALDHVAEGLFEDEMFSPEYTALRQEDYMDLSVHLQSLPPLQQEILRLRFGQDLSCSEIATALGKQENVVRVTLSRSLNLLRKIYQRRGEEQI